MGNRSMSRRFVIKAPIVALASRAVVPSHSQGQEATPAQRNHLIDGMQLSQVATSDSFKIARNAEVALNTKAQSQIEVQNRFDLAALEMFNVMKANEFRLANGEMTSFIAAGSVPIGLDTGTFSAELASNEGPFPITTMYYPEWATSSSEGQWATFDAKKGLKLNFVEEIGLVRVSTLVGQIQVYGMTPRLTAEGGLQLDIYDKHEPVPEHYPNPDDVDDIAQTWITSNMMQIMTLGYGQGFVSYTLEGYGEGLYEYGIIAERQFDMLFNPPYGMNDTIASLMSGKPTGSGSYVDYNDISKMCLLQFRPLS